MPLSSNIPRAFGETAVPIERADYFYEYTTYGITRLRDRSIRQRVESLISIATREYRQELRAQADKLMLW